MPSQGCNVNIKGLLTLGGKQPVQHSVSLRRGPVRAPRQAGPLAPGPVVENGRRQPLGRRVDREGQAVLAVIEGQRVEYELQNERGRTAAVNLKAL